MTVYLCYKADGGYFHGTTDGRDAVRAAQNEAANSGTHADAVEIRDGEVSRVRFFADGSVEKMGGEGE